MQLSKHFTLEEMTLSQTAARYGIDNTPSNTVIVNLRSVAASLEIVREILCGLIHISSGYRSAALNIAVNGATNSQHMFGLAADINVSGMRPKILAEKILQSNIDFDQLILEFDRWVHFGISLNDPRRQLLTIRQGTGYMQGLLA